ncbi:MAG: hypothetical protein ACOCQN_03440 [Halanaerobiaceae bacterium]
MLSPVADAKKTDINWHKGYVEAVGMAVAPDNVSSEAQGIVLAREGAIVDARSKLLEFVKGVHIDKNTTVANMMANVKINQDIEGFIKGTYVVDDSEKWQEDIYSVRMRKNLSGFRDIIYREYRDRFTRQKPTRKTRVFREAKVIVVLDK